MSDDALERLQRVTFGYFLNETHPGNGLVPDNTREGAHCSIAAVGLGLACWPVGVERGWASRAQAIERTRATLRFFRDSPQSEARDATGYRGFYYHFLDMETGRRAWKSELSTMDTAILLAGALLAAAYFDGEAEGEREIRELATASLPFAPEIVRPALRHIEEAYPEMTSRYGLKCSFNPTFEGEGGGAGGWVFRGYYGLDQGPVVLMIENHRSGLPWRWMRSSPPVVRGLLRAGFEGGWLAGRTGAG